MGTAQDKPTMIYTSISRPFTYTCQEVRNRPIVTKLLAEEALYCHTIWSSPYSELRNLSTTMPYGHRHTLSWGTSLLLWGTMSYGHRHTLRNLSTTMSYGHRHTLSWGTSLLPCHMVIAILWGTSLLLWGTMSYGHRHTLRNLSTIMRYHAIWSSPYSEEPLYYHAI